MLIPLNIVMTYPVHWSKYKIFRDFLQNFYDSVGCDDWHDRFNLRYDERTSTASMWIDGISFSYEWLLHIGASTKTNSSGNAGYFGEGFKIASLCALRDYHLSIHMSSGDWSLAVISTEQTLDGQTISMLAYEVERRPPAKQSRLDISPLSIQDFNLLKTTVHGFCYPENPLLGTELWRDESGSVYELGEGNYDSCFPCTFEYGRKGPVFCNFQLRGSSPFRLAVCLNEYSDNDRDRQELYDFDVIKIFERIAYKVTPEAAMAMLEAMRRYWGSHSDKRFDIKSWEATINELIRKVSSSPKCVEEFRHKHPKLFCLKSIRTMRERNRRSQARSWLSEQPEKVPLVQDEFTRLGYPLLEEACEKAGGFTQNDLPDSTEIKAFNILEHVIKASCPGFFCDEQPQRHVISNKSASWQGMAIIFKKKKPLLNSYGLNVKYDLSDIFLKKYLFQEGYFAEALSVYVHECCHVFGGDTSRSFSHALTRAFELLLSQTSLISEAQSQWESIFTADTCKEQEQICQKQGIKLINEGTGRASV